MTTTEANAQIRAFSVGKAMVGFIGASVLAAVVTVWLTIEHHGGLAALAEAEQPEIPFDAALWGLTAAAAFQLLWLLNMTMGFSQPARLLGFKLTAVDVVLGPMLYAIVLLGWWVILKWLLPLFLDIGDEGAEAQLPAGFDQAPEGQVLWLVLLIGIAVPVIEELYFRGVILHAFEHRYGLGVALVASSVLFGVVHIDLVVIIFTTWAGLVYAVTTAFTGRLGASIIAHALNNTIAILIVTAPG